MGSYLSGNPVSNQLISLASREPESSSRLVVSANRLVSNQLISLASRELNNKRIPLAVRVRSFQSINFPSE